MGILYLFLTFLLCFILVVFVKLAYLGILSTKKQPVKEEKKPTPQPKAEPVYYIVERKKTRKAKYSEPKKIEFKE